MSHAISTEGREVTVTFGFTGERTLYIQALVIFVVFFSPFRRLLVNTLEHDVRPQRLEVVSNNEVR